MTARFTLHGSFMSGPTNKVALMLTLAGEPFDYVHVDMRAGEHKTPAYLAKQRFGQVPLLVDQRNGRHLCQSAAILDYLADTLGQFGGASLDERIEAREWMFWDFDRLAPPLYRSRSMRLGIRPSTPDFVDAYAREGDAALKVLDGHLAGRSWIVGEAATIADIDIYGVVAFAEEGGFDVAQYPHVSAWMKRYESLPRFARPGHLLPRESRAAAA
jgi:glutathione S-transferase